MKELTIEEKAKRYDEVVEKARQLCAYPTTKPFISDLQDLFPELKESEDERIRKALIEMVHDTTGDELWVDYGIHKEEALAWLEKRDELINLPQFTFDDVLALQCCMETVKKAQEDKDLYEKLKDLHNRVYDVYQLEKQGEQKPAEWSEEDEATRIEVIKLLNDPSLYEVCHNLRGEAIEWLKSLKDRCVPQPKQEWSEEDKEKMVSIFLGIESFCPSIIYGNGKEELLNWLKSLRPHSQWKPSDEQMTALRIMKAAIAGEGEIYEPLNSLYEDLKKLREE